MKTQHWCWDVSLGLHSAVSRGGRGLSYSFHFERKENIPFSLSPSTLGIHQDQQWVGTRGRDDLILKRQKKKKLGLLCLVSGGDESLMLRQLRKGGWEAGPGMEER